MSGGRVLFVNKQTRQSLIKEIIQTTVIHSQNELLRELKARDKCRTSNDFTGFMGIKSRQSIR